MFFTDLLPQMRSSERAHLVPGVTTALGSSTAASTSELYDFPAQDYVALFIKA